jgi:hypothetical protein
MKKSAWLYSLVFLLMISCGGGDNDDNNEEPQREEDTTGSTGTTGTSGSTGTTGSTSGSGGTTGGSTTGTTGTVPDTRNACGIPIRRVQNIINFFTTLTNQRTFTGTLSYFTFLSGTRTGNGSVIFEALSPTAWRASTAFSSGGSVFSRTINTWEFKADGCFYVDNESARINKATETSFDFQTEISARRISDSFDLRTTPKLRWQRNQLNTTNGGPDTFKYELN